MGAARGDAGLAGRAELGSKRGFATDNEDEADS
jgi:hypothetical protein